jgi:hypothetical protein
MQKVVRNRANLWRKADNVLEVRTLTLYEDSLLETTNRGDASLEHRCTTPDAAGTETSLQRFHSRIQALVKDGFMIIKRPD